MSVQAISAVIALRDVSPPHKMLLMAMANYADHLNQCWPSLATIAEDIGVSRRHVARMLAELEAIGRVRRERRVRENNGCTSSLITLFLTPTPSDIPVTSPPDENVTSPSDIHVTTPVTPTSLAIETSSEPALDAKASKPSKAKTSKPESAPATRIAEDWRPDEADIEFARSRGLNDHEIQEEADGFVDYWRARARDAARRSWSLTWRTRIREIARRRAEVAHRSFPGRGGSGVTDLAAVAARRRAANGF